MRKDTILIVDDEEDIVSFIKDALEDEGYDVLTAYSGEEAVRQAEKKPQLVLLDVMMDGMDGFAVCQEIRPKVSGPILFLSACQQETDRIKGLIVGADDYLIKPFSLSELKARVYAHMRRERRKVGMGNSAAEFLRFGNVEIDYKGRVVHINGFDVELTNKQFEIIWLLAINKGQVFSRESIYERVWGLEADGDDSTITEHIKKIRAKFQIANPNVMYIQTVWGVGYKWV